MQKNYRPTQQTFACILLVNPHDKLSIHIADTVPVMNVVPGIDIRFPYRISIITLDFQCNVGDCGPLDWFSRLAWKDVMKQFKELFLQRNPEVHLFKICWATTSENPNSVFILCCEYLPEHFSTWNKTSEARTAVDHLYLLSIHQDRILSQSIKSINETLDDTKGLRSFLTCPPRVIHTQWHGYPATELMYLRHKHVDLLKMNVSRKTLHVYPPNWEDANRWEEDHAINSVLPRFSMPTCTRKIVADKFYRGHYVELPLCDDDDNDDNDGDQDNYEHLLPVIKPDLFCEVAAWCWSGREGKTRSVKKAGFRGNQWDAKLMEHLDDMSNQGKVSDVEMWSLDFHPWPLPPPPTEPPKKSKGASCCVMQ